MKKILCSVLAILALTQMGMAQTYTPIPTNSVNGYNIDAIAENTTALLNTTGSIDGSNYVLYSAFYGSLYSPAGTGLPNNGIVSAGTKTYQLQPYTQNNLVYLMPGTKDSLVFSSPAGYAGLSLLAFGTEGNATMSLTIRYTDNTTQGFSNTTVLDWFNGAGFFISGFDRVSRTGTTPAYASGNPRMYSYDFNLTCANRSKLVRSVIVQNNGTSGRLCVAAVSGAALPTYSVAITNVPCSGGVGSGTIVANGGLAPLTYTWGTSPVQSVASATGLAVGSYTYSVNDPAGCTYTSTAIMPPNTGSQAPPVMNTFQNPVCSGQAVTFIASGAATYTWTGGLTNGTPFNPVAVGSPVVNSYTVTGSNSCNTSTNSTVVSLTVNPNPTVTASASSNSLCSGNTVTLNAGGASTYTWSNAATNGVGFVPAATAAYSVIGTSSLNCNASAAITVTVVLTPTLPPVAVPAAICIGSSATITAPGATSYTWLPGNINTTSISVSPAVATVYTVTKANSNCVDTKTISIAVNPLPTVTAVSSSPSVCAGSTATLSATSVAGSTYTWQPGGATGFQTIVSPSSQSVFTVTANNGTCSGVATVTLSTVSIPTINVVSTSSAVCSGESATLTASGGTAYVWYPGGATTSTLVVTPSGPSSYSVGGVNAAGCSAGTTQIVLVNNPPVLTLNASSYAICNGDASTLTVSGASNYTWNTTATFSTIVVNPTQPTTFSVSGTGTNNCVALGSVFIDVFSPTVSISGNTVVCAGKSTTLTSSTANSYSWTSGDQSQSAVLTPASTTSYTLTVQTTSGSITCPATATVQVAVNPNPTVSLTSNSSSICKGETVIFTASGAANYTWSSGTATTATISVTPTVVTNIQMNVTGFSSAGCSGTSTLLVKVNSCNGIEENQAAAAVVVYPNPNNGIFSIRSEQAIDLLIIDNLGRLVKTIHLDGTVAADVSGLTPGIYYITGKTGESAFSKKIIVKD